MPFNNTTSFLSHANTPLLECRHGGWGDPHKVLRLPTPFNNTSSSSKCFHANPPLLEFSDTAEGRPTQGIKAPDARVHASAPTEPVGVRGDYPIAFGGGQQGAGMECLHP